MGSRGDPGPEGHRSGAPGDQVPSQPSIPPLPTETLRHPRRLAGPRLARTPRRTRLGSVYPRTQHRARAEEGRGALRTLGRRRSLMAADGDERRGAAPREGNRGSCSGTAAATPLGPWLLAAALAERPALSTLRGDPSLRYFRRLLRAPHVAAAVVPPSRECAVARARPAPTGSPAHRKRRARGWGGATRSLWGKRTSLEVAQAFACSQPRRPA